MQLIHHPGFINRVVYNACKAYAGQLKEGDWYDGNHISRPRAFTMYRRGGQIMT